MTDSSHDTTRSSYLRYLFREEHQYAQFVGTAFFFAVIVGFPLGLLLAHSAAQGSTLGGLFPQLVQVHGHVQLVGWFGLFVMGMGYRLVSRFTAVKHRYQWFVPLTLLCAVSGLVLRGFGQTFADEGEVFAILFASSGALEYVGISLFAAVILRALIVGRPDEFGYKPFFAAGVSWLGLAMLLNAYLVFVTGRAEDPTLSPGRTGVVAFILLYGFVSMFVLAVSVRTFPVFFGRERAGPRVLAIAWFALNIGIAVYAASAFWATYEQSHALRLAQDGAFALVGLGALVMVAALGIFRGTPHRLRESVRRNMRFVRSAYGWFTIAAILQVYFGVRALIDDTPVHSLQIDAVRHFIAIGFLTTVTIGMAFLVMPALAMRRLRGPSSTIVAAGLVALVHGAAAARGLGSLIADEGHFDEGYWTMTIGGALALAVMTIFVGYVVWNPRSAQDDIPLLGPN